MLIVLVADAGSESINPDGSPRPTPQACDPRVLKFADSQNLTPEEKIARMDAALMDSLGQFDSCQGVLRNRARTASGSGGSGSRGVIGAISAGAVGAASGGSGDASLERDALSNPAAVQGGTAKSMPAAQKKQSAALQPQGVVKGGGALPSDIPPSDNDSVLEAQIRRAALNEEDPEIKAQLWAEYRKYKGLPATEPVARSPE